MAWGELIHRVFAVIGMIDSLRKTIYANVHKTIKNTQLKDFLCHRKHGDNYKEDFACGCVYGVTAVT
jgi:hypothetical protein